MTDITLKAYLDEINQMIESGHTALAIDHCLHILARFPKNAKTYRLLGSAYLGENQYQEAKDIFLRLLSVFPDDVVAHIGISVILEVNQDLDGAIYHMERAYEIQPANQVLQSELRRLYGLRDGIEPQRLMTTTGALARMYYNGKLHTQAIAELRSAIKSDPNRVDLMVLLAQVYRQLGNDIEARNICSMILELLPYCFEANRILAERMSRSGKGEVFNPYLEVVLQIDPDYLVQRSIIEPGQGDYHLTVIQRLETDPNQPTIPLKSTQVTGLESTDSAYVQSAELPEWIQSLEREIESAQTVQDSPGTRETDPGRQVELTPEPYSSDEDTKPVHIQPGDPPEDSSPNQGNPVQSA